MSGPKPQFNSSVVLGSKQRKVSIVPDYFFPKEKQICF